MKKTVGFKCLKDDLINREGWSKDDLVTSRSALGNLKIYEDQDIYDDDSWLVFEVTRAGHGLDTSLSDSVAYTPRGLLESITPVVDDFENARNEQ